MPARDGDKNLSGDITWDTQLTGSMRSSRVEEGSLKLSRARPSLPPSFTLLRSPRPPTKDPRADLPTSLDSTTVTSTAARRHGCQRTVVAAESGR